MFKGKALLVIDRLNDPKPRWDVQVSLQSLNQDDPGDEIAEAFSCASYDCAAMPAAAYKMKAGDRIRVLVHFEIHYHQSWEGEWDFDLEYVREKVLRYQPYNSRRHRKKFYPNH